jgi:hypothetical protein
MIYTITLSFYLQVRQVLNFLESYIEVDTQDKIWSTVLNSLSLPKSSPCLS